MRRLCLALALLLPLPAGWSHAACSTNGVAPQTDVRVVDHYIADSMLHRRWAVTVDCSHPERPWAIEEVPWQSGAPNGITVGASRAMHRVQAAPRLAPLVAAGTKVRVWRIAEDASVQLSGIAMEAGAEGQTIHVRMRQPAAVLEGKVRGAGSVELLTSTRWKSQ